MMKEFDVPKDSERVDVSIQQENPYLSEQLTYELKK
jgi:hypothetical protein